MLLPVAPGRPLPIGVRLDGLVIDPCADGPPAASVTLDLRRHFAGVPALIYTELNVGIASTLLLLGRSGLTRVLFERIDDAPASIRAAVRDMERDGPRARAMGMLLEALPGLAPELAAALEEVQQLPAVAQTVDQLALSAGMQRRRLERFCLGCDLPSPSVLISVLRLLEVHELLRGTGGSLSWVSGWLGFGSIRTLRQQAKALFGCTMSRLRVLPRTDLVVRTAMLRPSAQVAAMLEERTYRSRNAGPAAAHVPINDADEAHERPAATSSRRPSGGRSRVLRVARPAEPSAAAGG